ncbi:MAG TPA: TolC family protein [Bryobacteraceae bacterium]|nr:TolC family protein [Bryobacteraceae bacterium]
MKSLSIVLLACLCAHAQFRSLTPRPAPVPAVDFENTPRIDTLLRAGSLYLSLSDAIALALDNNLDVEYERFEPRKAASDTLRAKGGGTLRGIALSVAEVPAGIGGPAGPLVNAAAGGTLASSAVPGGLVELSAIQSSSSGISITGASGFAAGPPIPPFDPVLTGSLQYQHQNSPQESQIASGTNSLIGNTWSGNLGMEKGFSTGALVDVGMNGSRQETNSRTALRNPSSTSSLNLNFTQPLLRGFGVEMNRRFIRIAKNNQQTSELVFRQQAIATIAGVIRLYDDLVGLIEDVHVKEQTLALAQRLYEDNRISVQQGTLAPVELTRAQAQVAAARQDLANSQGLELQQELIVKTVLTRRGTFDSTIRAARVMPTTPIEIPPNEPIRVNEDLVAQALRDRPELEEARLQIRNSHISLEGSRNQLLPELDLVATAQNAGLAGSSNAALPSASGSPVIATGGGSGGAGLGTTLGQSFSFRYPTYSIGLQLSLPLRNRTAEADVVRDEMQVRQWEIRFQQLQNQVRLEVEGAIIALDQARTAYEAAVEARTLQEQSLKIENEKLAAGLSTTFLVLQYQSFLAQARSTEVAARGVYAKARTSLERALGHTLEGNGIDITQVYRAR